MQTEQQSLRAAAGQRFWQIDALRGFLLHGEDSGHPDHEQAPAADAEAGEHAADESGQHGDEKIQHMSNRTPPNKISTPSARWSHFAGTF